MADIEVNNKIETDLSADSGPLKNVQELYRDATEYAETRFNLLKLKAVRSGSKIASGVVLSVVLAVLFGLFFLLLNIGVGFWLGEVFGRVHYGFLALAGFYLIIGFLIIALKNAVIKKPVTNMVIKKILNNEGK